MRIITPDSKYWAVAEERGLSRDAVRRAVRAGANKALGLLPDVSEYLTIMVSPDEAGNTIAETGDGGITFTEEYISLVFDYNVPYGVQSMLSHLRGTTGHEIVHAASYFNVEGFRPAPLQAVVYEGLATVFEKTHYSDTPPWSMYTDDSTMMRWFEEIAALPTDSKNYDYLFNHPDGRQWIIYKTGTWMIEKLLDTGVDFDTLLRMPHNDVIQLYRKTQQ